MRSGALRAWRKAVPSRAAPLAVMREPVHASSPAQSGRVGSVGPTAPSFEPNWTAPRFEPDWSEPSFQQAGESLPEPARGWAQQRFDQDLSSVRIHRDKGAGDLAKKLDARAFTVGR